MTTDSADAASGIANQRVDPDLVGVHDGDDIVNEDDERLSKGARTRQRILDLAVQQFGAAGYRSTSVSSIAREAGITQAAIYAYFDNKEALFESAVDADAGAIVDRAREQVVGVDVHALIPTILITVLGLLDQHPLAKRVLSGHERDQLSRLLNLPALARLSDSIAMRVTEAQEAGEARTDIEAQVFADGAESLLLGLLMAITQVGGSQEMRRQLGVLTIWDRMLRISGDSPDSGS